MQGDGAWADAALVLVGHGSTLNADSARPTYEHAAALRARGLFAEVVECFWKEDPFVAGVLRGVASRRVFVVPLFISDGYFTQQVIPRELGLSSGDPVDFPRVQTHGRQRIHYCGPVGTHASLTDVLVRRAWETVGAEMTAGELTCVVAGHGTGNNENSRVAIERQVEAIARRREFAVVQPAFMEEEPLLADLYRRVTTPGVVVVPFFISDGLHTREDIPALLGERLEDVQARLRAGEPTWHNPTWREGRRVWYARSIGDGARLTEVILERVREMAGP